MGYAKHVSHTGLSVSSLETSIAFYQSLGFEHQWTTEISGPDAARLMGLARVRARVANLVMGPAAVELFEFSEPAGRDMAKVMRPCDRAITHIGLEVEGLDEICSRFAESGYLAVSEPVTLAEGSRAVFLRDPDGVMLELFERKA